MPLHKNALLFFFIRLLTLSYRRRPLVCEHNLSCLFSIPLSPPQPLRSPQGKCRRVIAQWGVEGAQASGGGCLVLCVSWPTRPLPSPPPLPPPLTEGKHGRSSSLRGSRQEEKMQRRPQCHAQMHTRTNTSLIAAGVTTAAQTHTHTRARDAGATLMELLVSPSVAPRFSRALQGSELHMDAGREPLRQCSSDISDPHVA